MRSGKRCISFDSYIKPQLMMKGCCLLQVVYLLIPTSNHNRTPQDNMKPVVVYLLIPTSNHNGQLSEEQAKNVVYLLIPTSNHNLNPLQLFDSRLYIF